MAEKILKKTTKNRSKIDQKSTKNRPKIDKNRPKIKGAQKSRKKCDKMRKTSIFGSPPGTPGGPKIHRKMHRNFAKKTGSPKTLFFGHFCVSGSSRRRFWAVFGPKT